MANEKQHSESFLVGMWERIFTFFEAISIFYWIRKLFPKLRKKYWFVDAWVLGNLIFAFLSIFIISYLPMPRWLVLIIVAYGGLRVFEIFIYQMNVLLIHPFKGNKVSPYTLYSYRRMIVALIHNFFEIIFWFAATYVALEFTFEHSLEQFNPIMVVYYSFIAMVSYTTHIEKGSWTLLATAVLHLQAIIGLFMTVISLARFVAFFPKPETMDQREREETMADKMERMEKELAALHKKMDLLLQEEKRNRCKKKVNAGSNK